MIVLTILKVIGMVLLVILLLILLLISIILFVPVRYRSMGYKKEADDDYCIWLNASWFLKALRFNAVYNPNGLETNLKFLWLTLKDSKKDESETEEETTKKDDEIPPLEDDQTEISQDNDEKMTHEEDDMPPLETDNTEASEKASLMESAEDIAPASQEITAKESEREYITDTESKSEGLSPEASGIKDSDSLTISIDNHDSDFYDIEGEPLPENTDEAEKTTDKKRSGTDFTEKTTEKFRGILDKIEKVSGKVNSIKSAITDEENKLALKLVIKNIKYLLRHYRFRRLDGNLTYGSEDPYSVGNIMMFLSLIYPVYGECFTIEPVFDRTVLRGNINFKGRIRLIHLLIALIELMLNKKIRQFVINHL